MSEIVQDLRLKCNWCKPCQLCAEVHEEAAKKIEALTQENAKLREARSCQWKYDSTHDKYDTACGKAWQFSNDVGVKENGLVFCPFCGGTVKEGGDDERL